MPVKSDARRERLAAALRENLKRRKARQRALAVPAKTGAPDNSPTFRDDPTGEPTKPS